MKKEYTEPRPLKTGEWHGLYAKSGVFMVLKMDDKYAWLRSPRGKESRVLVGHLRNRNFSPQMEDFFRDRAAEYSQRWKDAQ